MLTNRRKWSWRLFFSGGLTGKKQNKTASQHVHVRTLGLGPRFLPLSRRRRQARPALCRSLRACGLWQGRGSCMSVDGSHFFTPTSGPFQSISTPDHRHTGREEGLDWTGLDWTRIPGMAVWNTDAGRRTEPFRSGPVRPRQRPRNRVVRSPGPRKNLHLPGPDHCPRRSRQLISGSVAAVWCPERVPRWQQGRKARALSGRASFWIACGSDIN